MFKKVDYWLSHREAFSGKFWILLFFMVCSLFFLLFQGGKLAFMLFLIVSILGIYLTLGRWSGIASAEGNRFILNSNTSGDLEAGTSLQVHIQVHIPGFWPIPYVIVKDNLICKNGSSFSFETTFVPDFKRKGEVLYKTPALRRGFYKFTETACSTEDIFGLFEHKGTIRINQSFRILPQTVEIKEWKQYNKMIKGAHHHSAVTRASRETTQINGVREYVYGDRISRIHWKTTARTGTWKSKEFERESMPRTIIVLDRNAENYKDADHFEKAVSTAASFFRYGLSKHLALGLLSIGKESTFFEAKRGIDHQKVIMNHLIEVEANGQYGILDVLKHHSHFFSQGLFVLLITPQSDMTTILQSMSLLKQGQMTPCHFWIASQPRNANHSEALDLSRKLKSKGFYGYAVHTLQELPQVLGGKLE